MQEGNLSDLTSLTEKLTDCELNIEECDVKLLELKAQQKQLQNKILVSLYSYAVQVTCMRMYYCQYNDGQCTLKINQRSVHACKNSNHTYM